MGIKKLRMLEIFAGIGSQHKALSNLNADFEIVDAIENDKAAIASYNAIHGTNFPTQDVTTWDKELSVDVVFHSSPCQDYSVAGKRAGGDQDSGTRSSLMWESVRIIGKLKPKYVIWENVKNVIGKKHVHNFKKYINDLSELGYKSYFKVLNAKDFGLPQRRERIFCVSVLSDKMFEFPQGFELTKTLQDFLEPEVEELYYLTDRQIIYIMDLEGNTVGTGWDKRLSNERFNKRVASTIGCRSATAGRIGITNFIFDGMPEETNVKDVKDKLREFIYQKPMIVASRGRPNENGKLVQQFEIQKSGLTNTLTSVAKDNCVIEKRRIRRLTEKEMFRLMGFADKDYELAAKVSKMTQLQKQAGNTICVPILEKIFEEIIRLESEE